MVWIKAGEEILADYGPDYWDGSGASSSEPDIDSDIPLDQVKSIKKGFAIKAVKKPVKKVAPMAVKSGRKGVPPPIVARPQRANKSSKPKFKVSAMEESEEEKRDESSEDEFIKKVKKRTPKRRTKRRKPKLKLGRGGLRIV